MIKYNLFLIFVFTVKILYSQVTFMVETLPENASENTSIYISGDFEAWTGGQEKYKLLQTKFSRGLYLCVVKLTPDLLRRFCFLQMNYIIHS